MNRSNDRIEISIGSDDGVRVGNRLNASNALGAEIEVLGVHADRSVARVIREVKSTPIKVGATVHLTGRPVRRAWCGRLEWSKAYTHTSVHVAITGPPNTEFDYNRDGVPDRLGSVRISESDPDGLSVWLNHPKYGRMIAHLEPQTDVAQTQWLQHHSINVRLTSEDLEHCHSGNAVTKVIYLPENSLEAMFGPNVVVSAKLDPGVKPLELAKDHGTPLLVVTLSLPEANANAASEMPGSANPVFLPKVSPSSTGAFLAGSEPKLPPYLSRMPDQPDGSRSIADIVDQFNRAMQSIESDYPQPPLTVEEVICCCQWKLQTDNDLPIETRKMLKEVAIVRRLPEPWAIAGGGQLHATDNSELGGLHQQGGKIEPQEWILIHNMQLVNYESGSKVVIRDRFLEPPAEFKTPTVANSDEKSMPLTAAIAEFNAMHHSINGKRQPPLTTNEVLAAIVHWKSRRDEAAVDNGTFEKFQRIAKTHQLSADAKLEVISSFESRYGDTFQIWSVRLVMPQESNPERTFGFTIREQFVSVSSVHDSMIHWGKPNDDGLQAGIRLIPGQRVYQIGQTVQTEFLYRSISGKPIDATLFSVFSHKKLTAKDAEGNELNVVEHQEKTIGGAIQTTIGEKPTRKQGQPLRLKSITPVPANDFPERLTSASNVIAKPKQKVFLQYEVSDLNGGSIRTGEFEIEIADDHYESNGASTQPEHSEWASPETTEDGNSDKRSDARKKATQRSYEKHVSHNISSALPQPANDPHLNVKSGKEFVRWTRRLKIDGADSGRVTAAIFSDGAYYLAGHKWDEESNQQRLWVWKVSLTGDKVWEEELDGERSPVVLQLLPARGKSAHDQTGSGVRVLYVSAYVSAMDTQTRITHLNADGEVESTIRFPWPDHTTDVIEYSDGDLLLFGGTTKDIHKPMRGWVARTSPLGEVKWRHEFTSGSSNGNNGADPGTDPKGQKKPANTPQQQNSFDYCGGLLADESAVLIGQAGYSEYPKFRVGDSQLWLVRIDANGKKLAETTVDDSYTGGLPRRPVIVSETELAIRHWKIAKNKVVPAFHNPQAKLWPWHSVFDHNLRPLWDDDMTTRMPPKTVTIGHPQPQVSPMHAGNLLLIRWSDRSGSENQRVEIRSYGVIAPLMTLSGDDGMLTINNYQPPVTPTNKRSSYVLLVHMRSPEASE